MSRSTATRELDVQPGHLRMRINEARPAEVPFLFEQQSQRMGNAVGLSVLVHGAMVLVAILVVRFMPHPSPAAFLPDRLSDQIVWLSQPGPGGGGGGGGNQNPEPPKKAELPGREKITVPAVKPPAVTAERPKPEPPAVEQQVNIPAKTMSADVETAPGVIAEGQQASNTTSQGMGTGGGAGSGSGSGIGPGQGSGLGPGFGGGTGGGAYRPGNGVDLPRVIREVKPQYTADAMRAKVQGTVWLECIVLPDGTVGSVEVIKSLDPTFGLDQEAVKAAKQWRFVPGTRQGQPVPVLVTIELTFTLR